LRPLRETIIYPSSFELFCLRLRKSAQSADNLRV
jgi:hypothetical protein